mgnify:CR=1 FL=1
METQYECEKVLLGLEQRMVSYFRINGLDVHLKFSLNRFTLGESKTGKSMKPKIPNQLLYVG